MTRTARLLAALSAAATLGVATPVLAADIVVTADTPGSFRATFTGLDIDASSIGGNDFQTWTFGFWSVLVNLRVDGVDGNGAYGFYEINLIHSGSIVANPSAPVVKTFLFFSGLQAGDTLTDASVSSGLNGAGSDYLSTSVNVVHDASANTGVYSGSIAGDADLDADGEPDAEETDEVVKTLKVLKDVGVITGREMGQIIKQTKRPRD